MLHFWKTPTVLVHYFSCFCLFAIPIYQNRTCLLSSL